MSGGGGAGSDDMQVSGAEAAYSTERGISTHSESRVGPSQASRDRDNYSSMDQEEQAVYDAPKAPDTSTVGWASDRDDYSSLDQEGQAEADRARAISQGTITIDPVTGEEKPGRYRTNPNTGELEKADLSFGEHWANRPENIKWSPTLSLLWAGGKNVGEWFKNWGSTTNLTDDRFQDGMRGDGERARMNTVAPHAPYIVSGTTAPSTSPAANWFQNLGTTSTNMGGFNLATEYAAAKAKVAQTLNTPTAVGQLAVNQSPFYSWLQTNSLNKGIL